MVISTVIAPPTAISLAVVILISAYSSPHSPMKPSRNAVEHATTLTTAIGLS